MTRSLAIRAALLLAGAWLAGCPAGRAVPHDRGPSSVEGFWWPDSDQPREASPVHDTARPPDRRPPDTRPPQQGTSCTNAGLTFDSDKPPAAGATLTLSVSNGPGWTSVLGGIASTATTSWIGGAQVTDLGGGKFRWTFAGLAVPGPAGPWSFCFMKGALNDDPSKGTVVGCCKP